tara:strand:- start:387 stop:725 length:339 start_codon:yes stop_codon:yes gene_type:complete
MKNGKYLLTIFLAIILVTVVTTNANAAEENGVVDTSIAVAEANAAGLAKLGAGFAIGLAGLGAGIGMGIVSSASLAAMVDKPELFSRAILFIVLIEAIAIYGLVVAFMLLIL